MKRTALTKRAALLLFAGLFGLATLQTATAQDNNHDVTIKVDEINDIAVSGAPTIDIGQDIDEWKPDDDAATYDVETNAQSERKIEVSASGGGTATKANYGLRVSVETPGAGAGSGVDFKGSGSVLSGSRGSGSSFVLTDTGTSSFASGDFITGFQQVGAFDLALDYEAKVNYDYNPANNATVTVTYTLTSN